MKKNLLVVAVVLGLCCVASYIECNYTRHDCVVVEASSTGAIFEDKCGYTWYVDCEGYEVGDKADLKMFNNYTDNCIDDDEIKDLVRVD